MPEIYSNSIQAHIARFNNESNEYEHLILRRAEDEKIFPLMWQTVTGWIDANETAYHAALREIKEESGLIPARFFQIPYIASFYAHTKDFISLAAVFGALVESESKVEISFEHCDYTWLNKNEALKILPIPSHRKALKLFDKMLRDNSDFLEIKINNIL